MLILSGQDAGTVKADYFGKRAAYHAQIGHRASSLKCDATGHLTDMMNTKTDMMNTKMAGQN